MGESRSAVYVASRTATRLLGVTRQLVGLPWLTQNAFAWCGNVGPLSVPDAEQQALAALGERLARSFALRGLFGVDYLRAPGASEPKRRIVVLEVNPRFPASVEVLELAGGRSALPLHGAACARPDEPLAEWPTRTPGPLVAKAVVYAEEDTTVRADLTSCAATDAFAIPIAADLPVSGTLVRAGSPLLTVFARGKSTTACLDKLRAAAARFRRLVRG